MESLAYLHLANAHREGELQGIQHFAPRLDTKSILCNSSIGLLTFSLIVGTISPAWAVLQEGDRGEEVLALQEYLQKLGYFETPPTGYFGPVTKNALVRFQRSQQLVPDGIYGSQTQESLVALCQEQENNSATRNVVENNTTDSILRRGDRGEAVRLLQEQLGVAGFFQGNATGFYGTQTESAVMRFQESRGLTVDGIAGAQTRLALPAIGGESPIAKASIATPNLISLRLGSRGQSVAELQQRLKTLGYFQGSITGYFGEQTQKALMRFQQERELRPDGIAGANTLAALEDSDPKDSVRTLQQRLQAFGYYNGPIDGIFGPQTQQALEAAQRANNVILSE